MEMEGLGYDILNVPDHLSELIGPMSVPVSAAEATKRLWFGANVLSSVILSW
jgi:hypothetical protein